MDAEIANGFFWRVLLFAPAVVALAAVLFVGLLVLVEKSAQKIGLTRPPSVPEEILGEAVNPKPGLIVGELKEAVASDKKLRTPTSEAVSRPSGP